MKVIVLAAGASERMGQPKQLLAWQGKTLLQHCLDKLEQCKLEIILVLGAHIQQIENSLDKTYTLVENQQWSCGMGSSIALGIDALDIDDEAVMLMLADQPAITAIDIKQLLHNWYRNPSQICCSFSEPTMDGNKQHKILTVPAIFPRHYFSELSSLDENNGAKSILKRDAENLTQISMPNSLININTTDDWNHWLQQIAAPQDIQEDTNHEIYAE